MSEWDVMYRPTRFPRTITFAPDLLKLAAPALEPACVFRQDLRLAERVRVQRHAMAARLERDARHCDARRLPRRVNSFDARRAREESPPLAGHGVTVPSTTTTGFGPMGFFGPGAAIRG